MYLYTWFENLLQRINLPHPATHYILDGGDTPKFYFLTIITKWSYTKFEFLTKEFYPTVLLTISRF